MTPPSSPSLPPRPQEALAAELAREREARARAQGAAESVGRLRHQLALRVQAMQGEVAALRANERENAALLARRSRSSSHLPPKHARAHAHAGER